MSTSWMAIVTLLMTVFGQNDVQTPERQPSPQDVTTVKSNPEATPSDEGVVTQIAADIVALEHKDFKVREAASRRLLAQSTKAVKPLVELATSNRPEGSIRAFELLRELHRDGDEATFELIDSAYEEMSASEDLIAAARADRAMEAASVVRRSRAIISLKRLGAVIRFSTNAFDDDADSDPKESELASARIRSVTISKNWKGGDDGLKYLLRVDELRNSVPGDTSAIYLIKSAKISEDARQAVKFTFPNCVERGPACFGVTPIAFGGLEGLPISKVLANSAADRAGLQQGDVILKFDGTEITNFNELVDKIAEHEPGDKVQVEFIRECERKSATVELRDWE